MINRVLSKTAETLLSDCTSHFCLLILMFKKLSQACEQTKMVSAESETEREREESLQFLTETYLFEPEFTNV